jgi:serine/threonine protein kinase
MSYKLQQKINSGGMAELWIATKEGSEGFKKACAVKIIRSDLSDREDFAKMFMAEAKILSNMTHANIMHVMDLTTIDQSPAIVMDLNIGGDLGQIYRQSFDAGALIPIPMLLYVIASVAQGLHYAHNFKDPMTGQLMAVVHRDISPGNILLSVDGKVRLSDFGVAKAANRGFETDVGQIKGKYSYMSPEQLQNKSLDHRSDLFSLGVVLWEGLAGRFRFHQLPDLAIYEKLAQFPQFESLLDINSNVSAALNEIVSKCLATDPGMRYRSALELARDLEKQLNDEFSSFSPEKLGKFVERSLKSQVDLTQNILRQALSADGGVPGQSSSVSRVSAVAQSESGAVVTPALANSSVIHAPAPSVVRNHPPGVSVDIARNAAQRSSSESVSVSSITATGGQQEDCQKINIIVHVGQNKQEDHSSFLHKGKDLTLAHEAPSTVRPKLSVSKTNLKPMPYHSHVTARGPSAQKSTEKKSGGLMGLLLTIFIAAGLAWALLNAPLIRQFIKTIKAG